MSTARKREVPNGNHPPDGKARRISRMSPGLLSNGLDDGSSDVVVVGAGPAGLMLATNLVRFGIKVKILDDRPDKTSAGRADGLQPKTIETLRQMRLETKLMKYGARFYDICFWSSDSGTTLRRTGREMHYPKEAVDLLDPYMILAHQGMVEEVFLEDLEARGVEVQRSASFLSCEQTSDEDRALGVVFQDKVAGEKVRIKTDYLVGCDGAHSQVRGCIPGSVAEGASSDALWGVLDGDMETDFPDLWSKAVVYSHKYGNTLVFPRERNMSRLYIELKSEDGGGISKAEATQEYVMGRARQILQPYKLSCTSIEWFGVYQIGQRVASRFADDTGRIFIAGDASHTHSPKAAQGMNTSMHDSLNLAWKLNLEIRGLASPGFLSTYEQERRKIAQDLINFDYEHANAFHHGDPGALAKNFMKNVRSISGVGVEYGENILNRVRSISSIVQPGCLLPPAKVTRYIDANPVDIQIDIPMLGQYRIYFLCPDVKAALPFLTIAGAEVSRALLSATGSKADRSYKMKPRNDSEFEEYLCPDRYTAVSQLFTLALVTSTPKAAFEIADLPPVLSQSKWTVYLDDIPEASTNGQGCLEKWMGDLGTSEVAILNVRPDGYAGSVRRWDLSRESAGMEAASWLREYYGQILHV